MCLFDFSFWRQVARPAAEENQRCCINGRPHDDRVVAGVATLIPQSRTGRKIRDWCTHAIGRTDFFVICKSRVLKRHQQHTDTLSRRLGHAAPGSHHITRWRRRPPNQFSLLYAQKVLTKIQPRDETSIGAGRRRKKGKNLRYKTALWLILLVILHGVHKRSCIWGSISANFTFSHTTNCVQRDETNTCSFTGGWRRASAPRPPPSIVQLVRS